MRAYAKSGGHRDLTRLGVEFDVDIQLAAGGETRTLAGGRRREPPSVARIEERCARLNLQTTTPTETKVSKLLERLRSDSPVVDVDGPVVFAF